ncbi:Protein of unknown function [Pustulibacterium marinum]|uniref:DUF3575 domain-containing protein n=1 Tax=Pustulibacterium marinum TaxID=1224947 RepID=A0A1I7ET20_9FLAO|nr:DUF3575 domain-containing protein [Pustulibacterium marinum]SFU27061.1 Protein of unknown function [Pustulibacterium marinum]
MKLQKTKYFLLFLLIFLCFGKSFSQTYVKGNATTALLLMPSFGIETKIANKVTFQFDLTGSMWESFNHGPQKFLFATPEVRYYTKEIGSGFFAGINGGAAIFEMQKYNYWNTDKYQKGHAFMVGATVGYSWRLNEKWGLEAFLGGGFLQSYYKGYLLSTGYEYTKDKPGNENRKWDMSGDWLPYKGGLMITYKL